MGGSNLKKNRITPFFLLISVFLLMLILGICIICLGLQPPRITHSLPYTL